jgi:protein TonB
MLTRYARSLPVALLVTLSLVLVMHGLVATQSFTIGAPTVFELKPFVLLPPPSTVQPPSPPDRLPPPANPPSLRPRDGSRRFIPIGLPVRNPTPPRGARFVPRTRLVDGRAMPLVTVAPDYPPAMARRGIEGHVIVQFDVSATGQVENVRIIESSHRGFEQAAVQAALRFRYRPSVVNGEPVVTRGLSTRIVFRLRD